MEETTGAGDKRQGLSEARGGASNRAKKGTTPNSDDGSNHFLLKAVPVNRHCLYVFPSFELYLIKFPFKSRQNKGVTSTRSSFSLTIYN